MPSNKDKKYKSVLGRGLAALLEDSSLQTIQEPKESAFFKLIPLEKITFNPKQPRKEINEATIAQLAHSIKLHGVIQPITVFLLTTQEQEEHYQLISGERRVRAARIAGMTEIPAYIRSSKNDQKMLEWALIENIEREELNSIEIALSYKRLVEECAYTQEVLAERMGKNRSTITNYLRLLKLDPSLQAALRDQQISFGHAKALMGLETLEKQTFLLSKICKEGLSVRKTEEWVKKELEKKTVTLPSVPSHIPKEKYILWEKDISERLGTKVSIKQKKHSNKGALSISFDSIKMLEKIMSILQHTS